MRPQAPGRRGALPRRLALAGAVALLPGAALAQAPPKLATCQTCHGKNGIGTAPMFPNLAGQPAEYLEKSLTDFRSGARQNEQMSLVAKDLSDEEITALAEYYAGQPPGRQEE